jgi:hypothetical protein
MVAAAAASFSIIVEGWVGIPGIRGLASLVVVAMTMKQGWVGWGFGRQRRWVGFEYQDGEAKFPATRQRYGFTLACLNHQNTRSYIDGLNNLLLTDNSNPGGLR